MKIAQVCPYDFDRPGGVQSHIRDLALSLTRLGHEVTIIAPKIAVNPQDQAGLNVVRVGGARKVRYGATNFELTIARGEDRKRLDGLIADSSFDVIHYHTMWVPLIPIQIFRRSRAANVATFHDTTAPTIGGRALRMMFRVISKWLLPKLDGVIAVSPAPTENLRARAVKVHIVPPCTDLKRFANWRAGARKYGNGRINILFVGRLEKRKGAQHLMRAYARLCEAKLPVRLLIAGSGPEEKRLRHFAAMRGLSDVEFLGGFETEDSPRLYGEADIVCAPSPYGESFGIVIAEAMASGRPVVAAANAGYRTLLTGEAARLLFPPGDDGALYWALRSLVVDASLRNRLGEWGRGEAMRYDSDTVAPQLVTIYQDAIAQAKARGQAS